MWFKKLQHLGQSPVECGENLTWVVRFVDLKLESTKLSLETYPVDPYWLMVVWGNQSVRMTPDLGTCSHECQGPWYMCSSPKIEKCFQDAIGIIVTYSYFMLLHMSSFLSPSILGSSIRRIVEPGIKPPEVGNGPLTRWTLAALKKRPRMPWKSQMPEAPSTLLVTLSCMSYP